jgi:uncharacterized protein (TIGR02466 family)
MQIIDPWSPVILKDNFQIDWETVYPRIRNLLDSVKINSELEIGGTSSVTSNQYGNNPIEWPEFGELQQYIDSKLPEIISAWKLPRARYAPKKSWINEHPTGAYTEEHVHKNVQVVISYYLKFPKDGGRLLVRDPAEAYWINYPSEKRGLDEFWYPVDIQTGDIVFFPGWLSHKTEPNTSAENRYVLSVNYSLL